MLCKTLHIPLTIGPKKNTHHPSAHNPRLKMYRFPPGRCSLGDQCKEYKCVTVVPGTYLQFMQPSAQPRRKYCYLFYLHTTYYHTRRSKQSFSFSLITQHTIDDHPHHIIEHTRNDHTQLNVIEFQSLIDTKLIR